MVGFFMIILVPLLLFAATLHGMREAQIREEKKAETAETVSAEHDYGYGTVSYTHLLLKKNTKMYRILSRKKILLSGRKNRQKNIFLRKKHWNRKRRMLRKLM